MPFFTKNWPPSLADLPINCYFTQKSNFSSCWSSNKLCYFSQKHLTPSPANPSKNYVIFRKNSHSSSRWSSDNVLFSTKIQLLLQLTLRYTLSFSTYNTTPLLADPPLNYVIFQRKSNCSSSWPSDKLFFSTKGVTPPSDDPPVNYANFHKKFNSSFSWSSNKLCYFSQKIELLLQVILQATVIF